jgi:hypothetical protein
MNSLARRRGVARKILMLTAAEATVLAQHRLRGRLERLQLSAAEVLPKVRAFTGSFIFENHPPKAADRSWVSKPRGRRLIVLKFGSPYRHSLRRH